MPLKLNTNQNKKKRKMLTPDAFFACCLALPYCSWVIPAPSLIGSTSSSSNAAPSAEEAEVWKPSASSALFRKASDPSGS